MPRNRMLPLFMLLALLGLLATGALRAAAAPAPDSAVYNDATQARLRVQQCVLGGPDIDIYVNGQVAVNGGVPMAHLGALRWTGYLYLRRAGTAAPWCPAARAWTTCLSATLR